MSGELPKGWAWTELEELKANEPNSFTDGPFGSKLKTEHYVESGVRVVRLGNIGVMSFVDDVKAFIPQEHFQQLRKHEIFAGDLLIAALAEPVGRCCEVPPHVGQAIVKADCIRFNPSKVINPKIILYWLNSPSGRQSAEALSHGLGRLRINMQDLRTLPVPVPPAAEQTRIVEKIDALFERSRAAREELARIPKLIERYRQAVLEAAFRGDLTADWREKNSSDTNIEVRSTISIGKKEISNVNAQDGLPRGWTVASLSQIADVETGATPKKGVSEYYQGGDIPWVTSGAVNEQTIDQSDQYITRLAIKETNCKIFPPGSLIMAMYGEGKTRGKVSELGIYAATNQACAAIIIRETEKHNKDYVRYFLEMTYLSIRSRAAGGVQPNLNLSIIGGIEVPFATLGEQRLIVERVKSALTVVDVVKAQYEKAESLTQRLDQAILDKAFRGELVPQDPNDEPASVLLERIKAARAAAPAPRRGRRAKPAE